MNLSEAKIIFGITKDDLSKIELKKVYYKKMLKCHPDVVTITGISEKEANIKSQRIILAYEILSENLTNLDDDIFKNGFEDYYKYKTSNKSYHKKYYDHNIDNVDEKFINRIFVESSNVKWIDYIKELSILVVRFRNSSVYYLYYDVPEDIFIQFQKTTSPGRFVHQFLLKYHYDPHSKYAEWLNVYHQLNEITDMK